MLKGSSSPISEEPEQNILRIKFRMNIPRQKKNGEDGFPDFTVIQYSKIPANMLKLLHFISTIFPFPQINSSPSIRKQ